MYPLYSILPLDISNYIRDILLSRYINNKILIHTHNFDEIMVKYTLVLDKYEASSVFNIYNIFTDIQYICKNINNLYIKCFNKYNIPNYIIPEYFINTKNNLSIFCNNLKNNIQRDNYFKRYINTYSITINNVNLILSNIGDK